MTGLGAATPLGIECDEIYDKIIRNDYKFMPELRAYKGYGRGILTSQISDEYNYEILKYIFGKSIKISGDISAATKYALYSILKALDDAKFNLEILQNLRVAIIIGSNDGECNSLEHYIDELDFNYYSSYKIAEEISKVLKLKKSRIMCIHNACASSNAALEIGYNLLKQNKVDIALVGGTECFSKRVFAGLSSINMLSANGCNPFEKKSGGVTIGEGAAMLVLEKENNVLHRKNVNKYCEVFAVASSNGSESIVETDSVAIIDAYNKLLEKANLKSSEIDYIMSHGTGSQYNDGIEAFSIMRIMSSNSANVCAIKGTLGYMLGAAGGVGALIICKIFQKGWIPGCNQTNPEDINDNIELITNAVNDSKCKIWCNNSFGMGGNNSLTLYKRLV